METQRKRKQKSVDELGGQQHVEPKKLSVGDVKIEENLDGVGEESSPKPLDLDEFPILTSMISAPKIPKVPTNGSGDNGPAAAAATGYLPVYNAFCQFLNGYLAAGGDPQLANTLANYAAALPAPTKPVSPPTPARVNTEDASPIKELSEQQAEVEKAPIVEEAETEKAEESDDGVEPKSEPKESMDAEDLGPLDSESAEGADSPKSETPAEKAEKEVTSEIQRLREAAFGRYRNVLCVICNEWICSRNRKNHIEAHLNYRPYKCSACDYSRRREIFVIQHLKTHHAGQSDAVMITNVDLNIALEVDRLAMECVERTRKLIENMQEKKDDEFGGSEHFDEKALELMLAEEQEKKVVVIESVSEVRVKVANYHRRQRTKVLKKIYDTDAAKKTELKIAKDDDGVARYGLQMEQGFELKLEDLMEMMKKEEEDTQKKKQEKEIKQEVEEEEESLPIAEQ